MRVYLYEYGVGIQVRNSNKSVLQKDLGAELDPNRVFDLKFWDCSFLTMKSPEVYIGKHTFLFITREGYI